jgi:hypothetical protein
MDFAELFPWPSDFFYNRSGEHRLTNIHDLCRMFLNNGNHGVELVAIIQKKVERLKNRVQAMFPSAQLWILPKGTVRTKLKNRRHGFVLAFLFVLHAAFNNSGCVWGLCVCLFVEFRGLLVCARRDGEGFGGVADDLVQEGPPPVGGGMLRPCSHDEVEGFCLGQGAHDCVELGCCRLCFCAECAAGVGYRGAAPEEVEFGLECLFAEIAHTVAVVCWCERCSVAKVYVVGG